jgi:uncharacterized protein (DUF488 family)
VLEERMAQEIWTIGHSTREIDAFVGLLEEWSIAMVADVRRFPGSKRHPQFNRDALERKLHRAQIGYHHFGSLGGRRHERTPGSPNTGWRVEAFNAYSEHMTTTEFREGLAGLVSVAHATRTAVMCSEALPWRCHRRIIADALIVGGWTVWNIMGPEKRERHTLAEFARVSETGLTYPAEPLFPAD